MASFASVLSDVGNALKKFFGVAVTVATAVEPFVDALLPGIGTLYNAVLAEVAKAETAAIAAGAQSGTGAQKLALVIAAIMALWRRDFHRRNAPQFGRQPIYGSHRQARRFRTSEYPRHPL